jgi:hypothetical protein
MVIPKNNLLRCFVLGLLVIIPHTPVQAQLDPLIEGAKLCTRHLQHYETQYGIPSHLLSAIASTESGRFHDGLKIKLPWPWTINAEGKGYFFDTKEEAIMAARKLQARGVESMDVGCMQVNIYHHPNAFASLNIAFEPENNVAYAASFLRNLYQEGGSWKQAASNYHSKTPSLGNKYIGLVYNSWIKIVDKLRNARLNIAKSAVNGLQEMKQADASPPTVTTAVPKHINVSNLEEQRISNYKSPHMKTIKVTSQGVTNQSSDARKRESGIIVVHPEITVANSGTLPISNKNNSPEPMVVADATPIGIKQSLLDSPPSAGNNTIASSAQSPAPADIEAKIIRLDNKLVTSKRPINNVAIQKAGPNFIFND